jgi:hypothetical protein
MTARSRKGDWIEQVLIDWAAWVHTYFDAQGCGGIDPGESQPRGSRGRGSGHGDPVLSEIIATDIDGQGQSQRVHRHLCRYGKEMNPEWFHVTWLRYVGTPRPTTTKTIFSEERINVGDGPASDGDHPIRLSAEVIRTFVWSGMKEIALVADMTGIKQRNVEVMIANVKRELEMDMRMDLFVLTGKVMPDGWASETEMRHAEQARINRERRRAERDLQSCG